MNKQIFSTIGTDDQAIYYGEPTTPEAFGYDVEMQTERPTIDAIAQADGTWLV